MSTLPSAESSPALLTKAGQTKLLLTNVSFTTNASFTKDRAILALGMALCAVVLSRAINVHHGMYTKRAVFWLMVAAILCLGAVVLRVGRFLEKVLHRSLTAMLVVIAYFCARMLLHETPYDPQVRTSLFLMVGLGLLQAFVPRALRMFLLLSMLITFCIITSFVFLHRPDYNDIDVFLFQQTAAKALTHGQNPYTVRFPNIYAGINSTTFQDPVRFGPGTPFYGPGVVNDNGWITYGFPYPPLSLLWILPAYLFGHDCRFADVGAIALSALLMAMARPGRFGSIAALLLLVNPQLFWIIDMSWTDPMLIFSFSLVMFCACRWRKGLPWALGLFLATKQYSVLALPALPLLLEGPNPFKELRNMIVKAGLVVAAITLPFFAWSPRAFIRAVVQWQFVQPFRPDSISYVAYLYNRHGGHALPMWTPFVAIIPAIIIGLVLCPRTPSGFAAAVALNCLVFFAINKQSFTNYYYFVIAAALWSVAAMWPMPNSPYSIFSAEEPFPFPQDPVAQPHT